MAVPEPSSKTMMAEALTYLGREYPIFPVCSPLMGKHHHGQNVCASPGKTPLVAWAPYQERLPTEADVRAWWTRWPNANIGLATGELSGVLVLDADGTEARKECLRRGGLDETRAVWTGKVGGAHFHLAYPTGSDIRNFARKLPGTDLRAQGGYVLLPPSRHVSGNTYKWIPGTELLDLAPVPTWLESLVQEKSSDQFTDPRETLDVEGMLSGFDEGGRDDGLFRLACRFRHDNQPQAYAEALIRVAARNCRPAFDADAAIEKVRRAYREYEPPVNYDAWIDELDGGPLGVTGTESEVVPIVPVDEATEGWKVYDAADFLAMEYPVVRWRIQGFLRDRAIMFNFGAPGSIKTYIATDAGLAVSTGGLFLGAYPCEQGRTLIVQEDTLDSDFQQAYLAPLVRARGIDPEELRGQLFIAPPGGMTLGMPERVLELCRWLEEYKPDLLILDAFYLMHDGEGYGKDLGPIMKLLKAIRGKYGCAIWVIDHDRKGKADGASSENPIDRLWGGRQKSAAVDAIMESRPVRGSHGETFLDVIKLRGAKPAEPIRVQLHEDYRLLVEGVEEVTTKGSAQAVYEWLCREGASRTKDQIARGCDLSARSVNYATGELAVAGLAYKSGKQGKAALWIAVRKADAVPVAAPAFEFGEDDDA